MIKKKGRKEKSPEKQNKKVKKRCTPRVKISKPHLTASMPQPITTPHIQHPHHSIFYQTATRHALMRSHKSYHAGIPGLLCSTLSPAYASCRLPCIMHIVFFFGFSISENSQSTGAVQVSVAFAFVSTVCRTACLIHVSM